MPLSDLLSIALKQRRVYRTRNVDNGGDERPKPPLVFITDSKRNDNFRRKIRFAELSLNIVGPKLFKLTKDKKNRSDETVDNNYHPARASSDVASSLAPSPGRRTDTVVAWSCRPLAAWNSSLVRPLLRPARSPWEGPAAPAEAAAVPIPNSPGGPQSSRRKSAGGGGCGDDRVW